MRIVTVECLISNVCVGWSKHVYNYIIHVSKTFWYTFHHALFKLNACLYSGAFQVHLLLSYFQSLFTVFSCRFALILFSVVGVCDLLCQMPDRDKRKSKAEANFYRESNLKRIIWHWRQSLSFTSCISSFISHLLKPNIVAFFYQWLCTIQSI